MGRRSSRRSARYLRVRAGRPGFPVYLFAVVAGVVLVLAVAAAAVYGSKKPERRERRPPKERVDYSQKWYRKGYSRGADWMRRCAGKGATEAELRGLADRMTSDYHREMEKEYEDDFVRGFMAATRRRR